MWKSAALALVFCFASPVLAADAAQDTHPSKESAAAPFARGRVTAQGSPAIAWEYHYDRNALRDTLPVADGFLSLTQAGNLLRFGSDLRTLRKEYFGPVPITCLAGTQDNGIVAGFDDGRIMKVDPATLTFSPVASVPGSVRWIGRRPAGWVVAFETKTRSRKTVVRDLATQEVHELKDLGPSVFMLDRKGRLWIGEDRGEWGGSTHWLDLASGKLNRVAMPGNLFDNIYGFIELANGQVLAFGGVMHMGLLAWFVTRVDCEPASLVYGGTEPKNLRCPISSGNSSRKVRWTRRLDF